MAKQAKIYGEHWVLRELARHVSGGGVLQVWQVTNKARGGRMRLRTAPDPSSALQSSTAGKAVDAGATMLVVQDVAFDVADKTSSTVFGRVANGAGWCYTNTEDHPEVKLANVLGEYDAAFERAVAIGRALPPAPERKQLVAPIELVPIDPPASVPGAGAPAAIEVPASESTPRPSSGAARGSAVRGMSVKFGADLMDGDSEKSFEAVKTIHCRVEPILPGEKSGREVAKGTIVRTKRTVVKCLKGTTVSFHELSNGDGWRSVEVARD